MRILLTLESAKLALQRMNNHYIEAEAVKKHIQHTINGIKDNLCTIEGNITRLELIQVLFTEASDTAREMFKGVS